MSLSKGLLNFNTLLNLLKLQSNNKLKPSQLKDLQFKKLKKLLIRAYIDFDFYKVRMDNAGFDPYKFTKIEEIQTLPLLTKAEYREFTEKQIAKKPKKYASYFKDKTSGSTGVPLQIYRSWNERALMLAQFLRPFFINGYRVNQLIMSIVNPRRVTTSDSIMQKFGILRRISVSNILPTEELVKQYMAIKPDVLYANMSNLIQMAIYAIESKVELPQPKMYFSVGETLEINNSNLLKSAFGPNIINHYGTVEMGTMGYEDSFGSNNIQFTHDTHLLEVLDEKLNPCDRGIGVITAFEIFSFPLIRYRLGDELKTIDVNGKKVIEKIIGRADDLVTLVNGSKRSANFLVSIMMKHPDILQYKVIQKSPAEFVIQLVLKNKDEIDSIKKELQQDLDNFLETALSINFEILPGIPLSKNGKLTKFQSEL